MKSLMKKMKKILIPLGVLGFAVFALLHDKGTLGSLTYTVDTVDVGRVALYYEYGNTIDSYEEYVDLMNQYDLREGYDADFFVDQFLFMDLQLGKQTCKERHRYTYTDKGVEVNTRYYSNRLSCSSDLNWLHLVEVSRDKLDPNNVEVSYK